AGRSDRARHQRASGEGLVPSPDRARGGGGQRAPRRQGPVMAKVIPGLCRFTNSQSPSWGSKVAPAHSEPVKSPASPLVRSNRDGRTTLFSAKRKSSPSGVSPCRYARRVGRSAADGKERS